ncbi:MAG: hypothetical protein EBR82_23585 [Caulobacteraceae bacterium]|nr:hypothetical protein [Caulobacteraceae bacterium]
MSLVADLRTLLLAQTTIVDTVPAQTIGGISYSAVLVDHPPQGMVPPMAMVKLTGTAPQVCMDGTLAAQIADVDIDCVGQTRSSSASVASAIAAFLDDRAGSAGSNTNILQVIYRDQRDEVVHLGDARDTRYYVRTLRFQVWHEQS